MFLKVGKLFLERAGQWKTGLLVGTDSDIAFYTFNSGDGERVVRYPLRVREYRAAKRVQLNGARYPVSRCLSMLKSRAEGEVYQQLRRLKLPMRQ